MEYKGHNVSATMQKTLYSAQLSITNHEGYKEDPTSFFQEHYVMLSSFKYKLTGYSTLKISEIIKTYNSKDRIVRFKLSHIARRMRLVPKNHLNILTMERGHPHFVMYWPIIGNDVGTVNVMIRFDYSTFSRYSAPTEEEVPFIVDQLPKNDLITTIPTGSYRKCERSGLNYPPCFTCFRTNKKLGRCNICFKAAYCSKECQKKHWKKHKKICKPKQ